MTENEIAIAFETRKPTLKLLGEFVIDYVCGNIPEDIFQIPPKIRVKSTESFLEKILRKKIAHPFEQIEDQVGARFVVLLLEDISKVCSAIKEGPWAYSCDRDFENEKSLQPEYFAYQSQHYVVTLDSEKSFDGQVIPKGYKCEIQVRTILQHAYAEMAHRSAYKCKAQLPYSEQSKIDRALAKGSALIETTDDVFKEIRDRQTVYAASVNFLFRKSAEIMNERKEQGINERTTIGDEIAASYSDKITQIVADELVDWVRKNPGYLEAVEKKRNESVLFRDSSILIIPLLITRIPSSFPSRWPFDEKLMAEIYNMMGRSYP